MSLESELDDYLEPLVRAFSNELTVKLQGHLASLYLAGSAQMTSYGKTKLGGKPILYEGPPMRRAMEYAQKHTAQLVKSINDETRSQLRDIIKGSIQDKRGIPGMARDIRKGIDEMTSVRSKLIARTESCDSLEQAFMDQSEAIGVTGKEVVVNEAGEYPCEICSANAAEGVVPLDHVFSSGHTHPPFHPNCVCALAPVMLPQEKKVAKKEKTEKKDDLSDYVNFTPYRSKSGQDVGGNYILSDKSGTKIGHASAQFFHKDTTMAISGYVPKNTMIIDSIELYSPSIRGKGMGSKFLARIENQARKAGMTQAWATSVMDDAERFWAHVGYKASGKGRIWTKSLVK
jgi:GNAT superfamily N-acetyltransferase